MIQPIFDQEISLETPQNRSLICLEQKPVVEPKRMSQGLAWISRAWPIIAESRGCKIASTISLVFLSRYLIQYFLRNGTVRSSIGDLLDFSSGLSYVLAAAVTSTIVCRFVLTHLHLVFVRSELERRTRREEPSIQSKVAILSLIHI